MGYLFPCHWDYNLCTAISYEKADAHSFMYTMMLLVSGHCDNAHKGKTQAVVNVDTC